MERPAGVRWGWMSLVVVAAAAVALIGVGSPATASEPEADPEVRAYQRKLANAGFYRGEVDGLNGPRTAAAIVAFEKAAGLEVDAVWEPLHARHLDALELSGVGRGSDPHRMEIDLTNQVAYLVEDGAVVGVFPVSSGNGELYDHPNGYVGRATTPTGDFSFYRRVDGVRRAPLGELYRPWYFRGGFALHGSGSVPAYPASHGCVRVTRWDADWLADRLELGMAVHIWAGDVATPPPLDYAVPAWTETNSTIHNR